MSQNTTTTATRFVGLDVHKREVTACIRDAGGQRPKTIRFDLTKNLGGFADSPMASSRMLCGKQHSERDKL